MKKALVSFHVHQSLVIEVLGCLHGMASKRNRIYSLLQLMQGLLVVKLHCIMAHPILQFTLE